MYDLTQVKMKVKNVPILFNLFKPSYLLDFPSANISPGKDGMAGSFPFPLWPDIFHEY